MPFSEFVRYKNVPKKTFGKTVFSKLYEKRQAHYKSDQERKKLKILGGVIIFDTSGCTQCDDDLFLDRNHSDHACLKMMKFT